MKAALLLSVVLVPALALAAGPQWSWEAGKQSSNGAITIKSTNGSTTYTGTQNPTGAVVKTNQSAATQPPTVIITAASTKVCGVGLTAGEVPTFCNTIGQNVYASYASIATKVGIFVGQYNGMYLIVDMDHLYTDPWGCDNQRVGATSSDGAVNTNKLISAACAYPPQAALRCQGKGAGWFLPSIEQANLTANALMTVYPWLTFFLGSSTESPSTFEPYIFVYDFMVSISSDTFTSARFYNYIFPIMPSRESNYSFTAGVRSSAYYFYCTRYF